MERRAQRNHKSPYNKPLYKLATICLVLVFLCLLFILNFRIKNVIVEGSSRYSENEIKEHLMTERTDNISFLFYLRQKLSHKKEIPFVETYDVEFVDKNTVKIQVYEKLVIGCVEVMGGYMYFDKDGMVVESSNEKLSDVPEIKGLKYNQVVLYEQLEVQKSNLYDTILNLTKLIHLHELPVQTIIFNSSLEVTMECDGNIALFGKKNTYDEQIAVLESLLKSAGVEKYTFDLRNYSKNDTTIIAKPLE